MLLTRASVAKLSLPDGKTDTVFWDDELKGFGVRLRAGGRKSWVLTYRNQDGIQRKMTLDIPMSAVDQARGEADRIIRNVKDRQDPQAQKVERRKAQKTERLTFGDVVKAYLPLAEARLRPSSYGEVKRHLETIWLPLHRLKASRVDHLKIAGELETIAKERGYITANRARASLSTMLAWAMAKGHIDQNPVIRVEKALKKEPKRDRFLNDDEIAEVWRHLGEGEFAAIMKLLVLTAARREEVSSMQWDELDLDRGEWLLPSVRTKNKLSHLIPLPPLAIEILQSIDRREGRELVFGSGEGGFSGWSQSKRRLDDRIAAARAKDGEQAGRPVRAMPAWRVHDIRRSVATAMARLGISIAVIERALNHVSGEFGGIVATYQRHNYRQEVAEAFAIWGDHVSALTTRTQK